MAKKTEQEIILELEEEIKSMEKTIMDQQRLINVMKTMAPIVEVKDDSTQVQQRVPKKGRHDANKRAANKSEDDCESFGGDGSIATKLEKVSDAKSANKTGAGEKKAEIN